MTLSEFTDKWEKVIKQKGETCLSRVNSTHPLDLYVGFTTTGERIFALYTEKKTSMSISSKAIEIYINQTSFNYYATCFVLVDRMSENVFIQLCWDLFNYTKDAISEDNGIALLENRFKIWQRMLQKEGNDLLSKSAIKGLLGELLFIKQYGFNKYGIKRTIKAWIGAEKADKDFVFSDNWYEVKTVDVSADKVQISSVEQLDDIDDGHLTVNFLADTSEEDPRGISLFDVVEQLVSILEAYPEEYVLFEVKLASANYIHSSEYNKFKFIQKNRSFYKVNKNFPRILKNDINSAITNVKYTISIAAIEDWKV